MFEFCGGFCVLLSYAFSVALWMPVRRRVDGSSRSYSGYI